MGTRKLGFALLAALAISLGVTSILYVRITRTQASARPKTKRIVAAAVALQPGTPITAENLTEISWPENVPLDGLIEKKEDVTGQDRKSTCLNSSHGYISYAVFCLKKKKKRKLGNAVCKSTTSFS